MGSEISAAVEAKFPAENIPKGKLQAFIRELLPPTLENYQNPEIIYNIVAIVKSQVSYDKDALLQIFAEYFSDPVESKLGETQTQIEYYMSDSNLAQDKFFNEKIRGASEGYISMEYLMKCQKLMKQTTSVQQMVAAIRNSSILEYKDLTFRRTGNSSVPELVAAKKSTVPKELPSLLYKVVTDGDEEVKCTWKDIKTAFSEKHPDIELQYTRFQVNEGTLGINGMTRDELLVDIGELTANGITFRVEKLAGDDLTDFFKKHGSHFDLCRKGKRETVREARHSQHTLGGKSFKNAKKILSYLKSIQNATTNGSEVEPKYVPILLDLLKLHPNWGSKYSEEDTKSFAVDKHPDYSETRCFFVIKQSGDREDFSMHKCLGKLKQIYLKMYIGNFSRRFNSLQPDEFIQHRPDTNVINSLGNDEQVKNQVVDKVIQQFNFSQENFTTDFHIRWAMEFLGYSFSLPPMDWFKTIKKSIEVYTSWLGIGQKRPKVIDENESWYQKEIICHFSLLFQVAERETEKEKEKHLELWNDVLATIRTFVIEREKKLDDSTWKTLLRIMLYISGPILSDDISGFAKSLSKNLTFVLFDIWIRSKTFDRTLWYEFHQSSANWMHNKSLIDQWTAVCDGFTSKVISMVFDSNSDLTIHYGPYLVDKHKVGKGVESRKHRKHPYTQLADAECLYFWYRFLYMLLDNKPRSNVLDELAKSIQLLVKQFVNECRKSFYNFNSDYKNRTKNCKIVDLQEQFTLRHYEYQNGTNLLPVPTANWLLDLFGPWLFRACRQPAFKAVASAVDALCDIFCNAGGKVRDSHIARFYSTFNDIIQNNEPNFIEVKRVILKRCTDLFVQDLKGVRFCLAQPYLKLIQELINKGDANDCYSALEKLIALPNFYNDKQYNARFPKGIQNIILETLNNEIKGNIYHPIWITIVYLASSKEEDYEIIEAFVEQLSKYNRPKEQEDFLVVIRAISTLPQVKSNINRNQSINTVLKISEVINKRLLERSKTLLPELYMCLLEWMIYYPEAFFEHACRINTLRVIQTGERFRQDVVIAKEAENCKRYLLDHIGGKVPGIELGNGTVFQDSDAFLLNNPQLKGWNYRIHDEEAREFFLATIYDTSTESKEQGLIIIRDGYGKYAWKWDLNYRVEPWNSLFVDIDLQPSEEPVFTSEPPNAEIEGQLYQRMSTGEQQVFDDIFSQIQSQTDTETRVKPGCPDIASPDKIARKGQDKIHRILLLHLGLLRTDSQITYIGDSEEFRQMTDQLDNMLNKQLYEVLVLYDKYPEMTIEGVMQSNQTFSNDFAAFIKQLGVKYNKHVQKVCGQSMELDADSTLYRVNQNNAFIFSIPGLDKKEGKALDMYLLTYRMVIIWNQRERDPDSWVQPRILTEGVNRAKFTIVITPKSRGLYQIDIHKSFERSVGPLLDKMLVTKAILVKMVIATLVNAQQELQNPQKRKEYITDRQMFIRQISTRSLGSQVKIEGIRNIQKSFS